MQTSTLTSTKITVMTKSIKARTSLILCDISPSRYQSIQTESMASTYPPIPQIGDRHIAS